MPQNNNAVCQEIQYYSISNFTWLIHYDSLSVRQN